MGALVLAVGLLTVDVVHVVDRVPGPDEKVIGRSQRIEAGGPAAVAAAVAARLGPRSEGDPDGPRARLVAPFGTSALRPVVAAWLQEAGVEWHDPVARHPHPAPVSSVLLDAATGARAVISGGAPPTSGPRRGAAFEPERPAYLRRAVLDRLFEGVGAVLVDGHALPVALAVARAARARGIPVVFDGGSAKPDRVGRLPRPR